MAQLTTPDSSMYFIASFFSQWSPTRRTGSDEIDSSSANCGTLLCRLRPFQAVRSGGVLATKAAAAGRKGPGG